VKLRGMLKHLQAEALINLFIKSKRFTKDPRRFVSNLIYSRLILKGDFALDRLFDYVS